MNGSPGFLSATVIDTTIKSSFGGMGLFGSQFQATIHREGRQVRNESRSHGRGLHTGFAPGLLFYSDLTHLLRDSTALGGLGSPA